MKKEITKGLIFELNESKMLGTMRIDWYDGRLCNQWNPTNLLTELKASSKIDLSKLQKELNYLQFELLSSFQRVEKYCGGIGYDREILFSVSLDVANYALKLIPVKDAYSYIYVYIK
jgi:hypothetical protein